MSEKNLTATESTEQVVDFVAKRNERIEEKRRKTERIFFKQVLGAYSVIDGDNLRSIEIVDVSEDGLSFQIPTRYRNSFSKSTEDEIKIRIYFSQETYLFLPLKIVNERSAVEESEKFSRFGCFVDKTAASYEAYLNFVRFLKCYAEIAHKDQGQTSLFFI